jgi:prepilin-type N-terminal cleavage/methylation domain-containing protein
MTSPLLDSSSSSADARGFSLIEAMIAMSILLVGLLGLAQIFCVGLGQMRTSSAHLIAREKAREAIESVHTSRDSRRVAWNQVRNVSAPTCPTGTTATGGGTFLNNEQEMKGPGADGLVNTADDTGYETSPGNDNLLGTSDDIPLRDFWRTIDICDISPNLRRVQVTVRYRVGNLQRSYSLTTFMSSFS